MVKPDITQTPSRLNSTALSRCRSDKDSRWRDKQQASRTRIAIQSRLGWRRTLRRQGWARNTRASIRQKLTRSGRQPSLTRLSLNSRCWWARGSHRCTRPWPRSRMEQEEATRRSNLVWSKSKCRTLKRSRLGRSEKCSWWSRWSWIHRRSSSGMQKSKWRSKRKRCGGLRSLPTRLSWLRLPRKRKRRS